MKLTIDLLLLMIIIDHTINNNKEYIMINNIITIDNLNDDLLIDFDTLTDNQKLLMYKDYRNNYFSINKFITDYCITLSQFKQLEEVAQ